MKTIPNPNSLPASKTTMGARKKMFVTDDGRNVAVTFALIAVLFALWGFCNGMIDVMDKHFQEELGLSLSQSAWVQFAHYLGYFLMALPAGWLATKLGYKGGIITGLLIVAVGGFWFIPATRINEFWAFLLGVSVIAAGLTFLETIANPYATVLGASEYGASRINLAQSCNGIGLLLGPIAGGLFFYSKNEAGQSTGSENIWIPYTAVGATVLVLAAIFSLVKMPDIQSHGEADSIPNAKSNHKLSSDPDIAAPHLASSVAPETSTVALPGQSRSVDFDKPSRDARFMVTPHKTSVSATSLWSRPHFVMAVVAQFLYIAAQAGIFSFFINYMTSQVPVIPESWDVALKNGPSFSQGWLSGWFEIHKSGVASGALGLSNKGASNLASLGFLAFLLGRFSGTAILQKVDAHRLLAIYSVVNVMLCLLIFLKLGWLSVLSVFGTYFFMSIMFPTIFALGIFGLGTGAKKASSFLVMAIMGGAVVPKVMGEIADKFDLSRGFIVPLLCFAIIAAYGFLWPRLSGHEGMRGVSASGGH